MSTTINESTDATLRPRRGARLRLNAWRAVVLAWLAIGAWWIFDGASAWVGWHLLNGLAVLMLLLLATTPPDAIKLPRERSERILLAGFGWFVVWSFFAAHASLLRTMLVAGAVVLSWHVARRILERRGASPWWAALLLWHPLVLAQLA